MFLVRLRKNITLNVGQGDGEPACSIRGRIGETVSAALTPLAASAITGGDQDVTQRQVAAIAAFDICRPAVR